jgi:hypothetical protein
MGVRANLSIDRQEDAHEAYKFVCQTLEKVLPVSFPLHGLPEKRYLENKATTQPIISNIRETVTMDDTYMNQIKGSLSLAALLDLSWHAGVVCTLLRVLLVIYYLACIALIHLLYLLSS